MISSTFILELTDITYEIKVRATAFPVGSPGIPVRPAPLPENELAVNIPVTLTSPVALKDPAVIEKLNALSDDEKTQLDMVLAPSLATILKKIAPDASSVIDQFTSTEENVVLPVSVVKNFATKRDGGEDETQAITSFIADLQESDSGMSNEMEQTNVPPDTQMANQSEDMISPEMENEDSGLLA